MPATTDLARVRGIGASTDAGKTSIANALAEWRRWQEEHNDRFDRLVWPGHWARIDPTRQPTMRAWREKTRDEASVKTTPEEMVAEGRSSTPERFALTLEDLRALSDSLLIVAEGYGFLPDPVLPRLRSPRQAIWLVSTKEFKRASYARRRVTPLARCRCVPVSPAADQPGSGPRTARWATSLCRTSIQLPSLRSRSVGALVHSVMPVLSAWTRSARSQGIPPKMANDALITPPWVTAKIRRPGYEPTIRVRPRRARGSQSEMDSAPGTNA